MPITNLLHYLKNTKSKNKIGRKKTYKRSLQFCRSNPRFTSLNLTGFNWSARCGSHEPNASSETDKPFLSLLLSAEASLSLASWNSFIVPNMVQEGHVPHHCPAVYPQLLQTHWVFTFPVVLFGVLNILPFFFRFTKIPLSLGFSSTSSSSLWSLCLCFATTLPYMLQLVVVSFVLEGSGESVSSGGVAGEVELENRDEKTHLGLRSRWWGLWLLWWMKIALRSLMMVMVVFDRRNQIWNVCVAQISLCHILHELSLQHISRVYVVPRDRDEPRG